MRLVDTSAWIEFLLGTPTGARVRPAMPTVEEWLAPTMVQLELTKWLMRNRSELLEPTIALSRICVVAPMTMRIALIAAEICVKHKLATADAVIYATAQEHGAELLTCDAHFRDLPGVILVEKT
ncbi:type II toxin-antitoxin system VapC family toxin [Brevundimonas aurifodinae]|uniref:Ribonuclease VapC n=2 Tax=Brevundimonas TaxID=41275 RepID=A0ABV1NQ38_9CAUL|nr:MAG: VapC toxin family PIN domain ribonuclease [Brevundimonas sp. 12-68-7]OYX32991.1 MAG: VapC toxin family PIN domain ribonuclease [Brevundimonas subvibrioides]